MSFLRNAWYCAAWSKEVGRTPLARTLLNEKLVLYRKEDGGVIAMSDVCPHRFAPMHKGKLIGDVLACPYHGLQFGEGGHCLHNPHGELIPSTLKLNSYRIVERDSFLWIWMGEPALADPDDIPEFSHHSDPGYVTIGGLIPIKGSYQLVSDNLLDLSHTQYLHPVLTLEDDPDVETVYDINQDGDQIVTVYDQLNTKPFGFVGFVWPDAPERIDSRSGIRWDAPANMQLRIRFDSRVPGRTESLNMWGAELITPETETTSHYFWSQARDFRLDDEEFSEALRSIISGVFTNEDGAMIADVQENMGSETDLIAMRPVILPTDSAAVRARMIVRKLIKREIKAHRLLDEVM